MTLFHSLSRRILPILLWAIYALSANAQQPAFPGAEGFGKYTTGGRGGSVYHVTNLNDSGAGSFRDAVSQSNRTVVFDVGGVINISSRIVIHSNVTVAGQTAPGDGITIYGNGIAFNGDSGNNIIRFIRIRMGVGGDSGKDAIGISAGQNYIFDHVSVSWGRDGTIDINGSGIDNTTIQDCIIAQGLHSHSTGGLMQSGKASVLRTLYIDNHTRNPKGRGTQEYINNVIYNWRVNGYILGDTEGLSEANIMGNYFISGPSTSSNPFNSATSSFHAYVDENWWDNDLDGTLDGADVASSVYGPVTFESTPYAYYGVGNYMTPTQAYNHVVSEAGASIVRDPVDDYLIAELTSLGTSGAIISNENENGITNNVGVLSSGTAATDTDQDGMPDFWESANGTNPSVADNNGDLDSDGYTNLEEYLDWVIDNHCDATTLTPYVQVNGGSWESVTNLTVNTGDVAKFGPQPNSGGSWSWSGCGTSGSSREQTITVSSSCTATATFTNSCGVSTSLNFDLTVIPAGSVQIQENETGFCSIDGTIDSNNAGYTGSGFANSSNSVGSSITWQVTASSSASRDISFRYANGGSTNRSGDLYINGAYAGAYTLAPSGGWTTWTTSSQSYSLNSGINTIELTATTSDGLPNIDWIMITNASASSCSGTLTIQENETGFCSVDGTIDSNNAGYTGSGFANTTNASGEGIEWNVYAPSAGTYTLAWQYANGGTSDRTADILINGSTQISGYSMPSTGSWTTWSSSSSQNVTLVAGNNTIRLNATTSSGLGNVDYITISGDLPSAGTCSGSRIVTSNSNAIQIYPNPATSKITIGQLINDTPIRVKIHSLSGMLISKSELIQTNELDVSRLEAGIYFIQVEINNSTTTQKLIIK